MPKDAAKDSPRHVHRDFGSSVFSFLLPAQACHSPVPSHRTDTKSEHAEEIYSHSDLREEKSTHGGHSVLSLYYVLKGINPRFLDFEHNVYKSNYLYTVFTIFY